MTTMTDPGIRERQAQFMQLMEPIHGRLLRFCRGVSSDKETARDLASESILIAWNNFDTLREPETLRSYLFSVASRLSRRQQARQQRYLRMNDADVESITCGISPEIATEVSLLEEALRKLPTKVCEAIVLFEVAGFSIEEIAGIQQSGVSAVKMRLLRGRKQLKKLLGIQEEIRQVQLV
ncbi:MAG TPA: RNA polymerase sigma factor [Candidatus Kapabacteria bacterium]|nr:RNA polymerase sigma factor [Candidatus Kapabacteria bacterium]